LQNIYSDTVDTGRFHFEDIFFSVTDERGVILSANPVFCHVAKLDLEKLIGAPHKIIRHPLMPRSVFRVLWDTIQKGEPIGAYVINQASDGRAYWVFALVIPIDGGYLSVRIKPSSDTLATIKDLYSDLRSAEDAPDYTIEAGVAALVAATAQMGFNTYAHFMTHALLNEMTSRAKQTVCANQATLEALRGIQSAVEKVVTRAGELRQLFEKTTQIPFNMRLQAVHMEGRDGPIGVIANNHQIMTGKLREEVTQLQRFAIEGTEPLIETQYLTCAMLLMEELTQNFAKEVCVDLDRRQIDESEQSRFNGDASGLQAIADALLVTESQFAEGIVGIEADVVRIDKAVQQLTGVSQKAA